MTLEQQNEKLRKENKKLQDLIAILDKFDFKNMKRTNISKN